MPAKVSEKILPTVTAGLAKDVLLVNQYAAPMYAPTACGGYRRLARCGPGREINAIKPGRGDDLTDEMARW